MSPTPRWLLLGLLAVGCSSGTARLPADVLGVGAQCGSTTDCNQPDPPCDAAVATCFPQQCLTQFKGGYCGIEGCASDDDCPLGAACVHHSDGAYYCFRVCSDKSQCNVNRDASQESNCSSNVDFVNPSRTTKACVPPS